MTFWRKEEDWKKGFSTAWTPILPNIFCISELSRDIQKVLSLSYIARLCNVARWLRRVHLPHGNARDTHSIIQSGLIPGRSNIRDKQSKIFTAVNPMYASQDPEEVQYDLQKPRITVHKNVDRNTSHVLLHSAHTEWCVTPHWLKNVFMRITPYSWSSTTCSWLIICSLSVFLVLFLSVCLSYPLLFSSHFYLHSVPNLFFHVDSAEANNHCKSSNQEFCPLAEFTPPSGYEPKLLDDFHCSGTTENIFQEQSSDKDAVPSYLCDAELILSEGEMITLLQVMNNFDDINYFCTKNYQNKIGVFVKLIWKVLMRWKNCFEFKSHESRSLREEDWSKIKTLLRTHGQNSGTSEWRSIVSMIREILRIAESVQSGLSHVPSQPALFPLYRDPRGLLSRNDNPSDIWNTQIFSGNVFANPATSSSSLYPRGFNPWISNVTEHTSSHVTSERQMPGTALDPRCQPGPWRYTTLSQREGQKKGRGQKRERDKKKRERQKRERQKKREGDKKGEDGQERGRGRQERGEGDKKKERRDKKRRRETKKEGEKTGREGGHRKGEERHRKRHRRGREREDTGRRREGERRWRRREGGQSRRTSRETSREKKGSKRRQKGAGKRVSCGSRPTMRQISSPAVRIIRHRAEKGNRGSKPIARVSLTSLIFFDHLHHHCRPLRFCRHFLRQTQFQFALPLRTRRKPLAPHFAKVRETCCHSTTSRCHRHVWSDPLYWKVVGSFLQQPRTTPPHGESMRRPVEPVPWDREAPTSGTLSMIGFLFFNNVHNFLLSESEYQCFAKGSLCNNWKNISPVPRRPFSAKGWSYSRLSHAKFLPSLADAERDVPTSPRHFWLPAPLSLLSQSMSFDTRMTWPSFHKYPRPQSLCHPPNKKETVWWARVQGSLLGKKAL